MFFVHICMLCLRRVDVFARPKCDVFDNRLLGEDRAVTLDATYAMFFDDKVVGLEVGKYADLVELDGNPRWTDPEKIPQIKVMATWLEGKPAYTGGKAEAKSQELTRALIWLAAE